MPSGAPSYYRWAQDKPCTTNQIYGYTLKDSVSDSPKKVRQGPFAYTRPFSNSAFFPQIPMESHLTTKGKPLGTLRPSKDFCPSASKTRFNINRGYQMGHTPVTEKVLHSKYPVGVSLDRHVSAPTVYHYPVPKAKEIYLWHTLSGSLVHAKHYPPPVNCW